MKSNLNLEKNKMIDIIKNNFNYIENDGILYLGNISIDKIKDKLYSELGININPDLSLIFLTYNDGVYIFLR